MKLSLEPVTREGCELARLWRNQVLGTLRTPFPLTQEQQEAFYQSLQDRNSPHRYWEVKDNTTIANGPVTGISPYTGVYNPTLSMVGLVGLTNIDFYNGCAEISLIISPNERGKGVGSGAVDLVLREAFDAMRLHMVYGEVYFSNPGVEFWRKVVSNYGVYSTELPDRKWWKGQHWNSLYFAIRERDFPKA